ncbi:MAG TPA: SusC/RagA family TonB-linked outer membrane protein, partial [Puia sp.]
MRFLTKTMAAMLTAALLAFVLSPKASIAQSKSKGADLWVNTPDTNFTIAELFKSIQKQTGYTLFYSNAILDDAQKMKFSSEKLRLDDLLGEVLTPQNVGWLYKDQLIILRKKSPAPSSSGQPADIDVVTQTRQQTHEQAPPTLISGKVVSETGTPVVGASVQLKGTKLGTATNPDGTFELQTETAGGVLVVSSVGYKSIEVAIGTNRTFRIVLRQEPPQLNDVVVVGYGTRKKSDLTGAVVSVSSQNLKDRAVVNFGEAIAGQMAGVQVQQTNGAPGGEGLTVRVRGTGSITQSNTPLYVVDGYPMEDGAFRLINPSDIASVQVLKDASSTAIYGSRGANGVVIITTRKGHSGAPVLSMNVFSGYQQRTRAIPVMNRDQYVQYFIDGRNQAWLDQPVITADPDKTPHAITDPNTRRQLYPSASSTYMIPDGTNGYKYNFFDPKSVATMADNNWQSMLFRTAPMQQYEIAVNGGGEKTTYNFSGSYIKQQGIVIYTDYERFNFHSNIESQLNKSVRLGLNMNAYSADGREQANGKDAPVLYSLTLPPIYDLHNPDGTWGSMLRNPEVLAGDVANPIGIAAQVERYRQRYGWLGTIYGEADLL